MKKIIIKLVILITLSQSAWSQGLPSRQLEVDVHAPTQPVGSIINLSEAGFAGLYYQAGPVVDGWVGYVGSGVNWVDPSTFQVGSSSKSIHLFAFGQRAMRIDPAAIAFSKTLHVEVDKDVLYGASMTGAGTKLFWMPEKGALRAGTANGALWDDSNIGQNSVAFGFGSMASNDEAVAFGGSNVASGKQSTAFGTATDATGDQSTSFGFQSAASGDHAMSWGVNTRAKGLNATAWGNKSIAAGEESTAWGEGNIAQSKYETVIGSYADTIVGANPSTAIPTDHLFVVGNGTSDAARSNALTIYKNGNTRVTGALNVDMTPQFIGSNTQINVESKGYLRLQSTANSVNPFIITLSDGLQEGQLLFISCTAGFLSLNDATSNTNLGQTRTLGPDDTIKLLWDGSHWLELSYSNN